VIAALHARPRRTPAMLPIALEKPRCATGASTRRDVSRFGAHGVFDVLVAAVAVPVLAATRGPPTNSLKPAAPPLVG
jgi:hypothetical protein